MWTTFDPWTLRYLLEGSDNFLLLLFYQQHIHISVGNVSD